MLLKVLVAMAKENCIWQWRAFGLMENNEER